MIKELAVNYPKTTVIVIAVLVTLAMTLITKYTTNQKRMKELKAQQKEHQKKMKELKGDVKALEKLNKEIWEVSMELMRHSFKPLLITMIPLLILLWWVRTLFAETTIATSWIWWYILGGIVSSIILRKVFDVV